MGRDPRYIPPGSLQHVVDCTFQHRPLLCPSGAVNGRFLGILGRAQKKFDMTVCAVVVLSTHVHYLLRPRDGAHLAAFMCFVKTNIAKEIGRRIRKWKGSFFDSRFHSTTVSDEESAQVGILRYILSHGVKEFLVDRVAEWPGVHSAVPTIDGTALKGEWIDRTAETRARTAKGSADLDIADFTTEETLEISPLPCWEHLPEAQWRQAVAGMIEEIDKVGAVRRRELGKRSLGISKVLATDPYELPEEAPSSPKPRFHARRREVLKAMIEAWSEVIRCFREASEKLRSGVVDVVFPEGTFPPALPFVPFSVETLESLARGRPL